MTLSVGASFTAVTVIALVTAALGTVPSLTIQVTVRVAVDGASDPLA